MSQRAWAYIGAVLLVGALLTGWALLTLGQVSRELATCAALTALATLAQLFKARFKSRQQSESGTTNYSPILLFLFAGVILLPPGLFVVLVFVPHLVEWAKERWLHTTSLPVWYIQPFNIATHILAGLAAGQVFATLQGGGVDGLSPLPVFAATTAALTYVLINHLLVGQVLVLARGVSWQDSGVLQWENLLPDGIMIALGYAMGLLWNLNPWLLLPMLSPLLLIHPALMVPQLKKDAQIDGKTGLFNAHHFAKLFSAELERARRFNRPLALVMADLDLLRNINNTYGHLAGDTVLTGISQAIRATLREYDIAGRFGGEEFAIVLPEAGPEDALALAERLRRAAAACQFAVATSSTPLTATLSLGIACFPDDGTNTTDLTHEADLAVYQAKLAGRNQVVRAGDIPHSCKLVLAPGGPPIEYPAAFARRAAGSECGAEPGADVGMPPAAPAAVDRPTSLPQPTATAAAGRRVPAPPLPLLVGAVIAAGLAVGGAGLARMTSLDLTVVAVFSILAVVFEFWQINASDGHTISVSVTIVFATALLSGIPGLVVVSGAVALAHYLRRRPTWFKTAFNWAVHVLAGAVPAALAGRLGFPTQVSDFFWLIGAVGTAGLIYYVIESGLMALVLSLAGGAGFTATWRKQFQWLAAYYLALGLIGLFLALAYQAFGLPGILVFGVPVLMMRYAEQQYVERTRASLQELKRLNGELAQANREIGAANQAIGQLNEGLFLTLAKILDARDPYVGSHAAQVATYAAAVARELGLPPERVELVRQAGFLHDIGKIAIAEQVLHKPGPLTPDEYAYIQTHATIGAEFLQTSQALRHLAPFVGGHHEHWDGRGYPAGLRGAAIPLEARILAVCDAVEAMASDRPYSRGQGLHQILNELRRCAGIQFDPTVAEVFIRIIERNPDLIPGAAARDVDSAWIDGPELLLGAASGRPHPVGSARA